MPNWVYQSLTVEGNSESVLELKKQLNTPFTKESEDWDMESGSMKVKEYTYSNPIFAFWNVIRPTDMEEYAKQPKRSELPTSDPNWWADTNKVASTDDSWYNWNNRNWGTKWDIAVSDDDEYPDTEVYDEEPNGDNLVLVYKFQTAWSPAFPVMEKLSAQYPDLLLTLNYQEETGWGGEAEFLRGEMISDADYNWECSECGHQETGEPPFCEDCEYDVCPSCGYNEADEPCAEHKDEE